MPISEQEINEYQKRGYYLKEIDGKIYIIKADLAAAPWHEVMWDSMSPSNNEDFSNAKIIGIVDGGSSSNTIDDVINNANKYPPKFKYDKDNEQILGNYISEVEAATGKKIESAVFNDTECEFVIDGKTVKVPYAENESISLDNAKTAIELDLSTSLDSDDFINEENIDALVSHLDKKYGEGYDFRYEKTSDGKIKLILNDQELIELDKFYKVGEVVNAIDSYTKSKPEENSENPNPAPSRPVVNRPKIHINLSIANEIKDLYTKAMEDFGDYGNFIDRSYINDKLKDYYDSTNDNSAELLYVLGDYIAGISTVIEYCINLYLAKDEKDYKDLESMCEELWGALDDRHVEYKNAADGVVKSTDLLSLENLSEQDYIDIMSESESLFSELYNGTLEDYVAKLHLVYSNFLRTAVPKIYNAMIEGVIMKFNYGDYEEEIKASFAKNVLEDSYYLEYIDSVPSDLWDAATTDYDKALLLCTYYDGEDMVGTNYQKYNLYCDYSPFDIINNYFTVTLENAIADFEMSGKVGTHYYYDDNYCASIIGSVCFPMINTMSAIKNLCETDYSNMSVDEVFKSGYEVFEYLEGLFNAQTMTEISKIQDGQHITWNLVATPGPNWENTYRDLVHKGKLRGPSDFMELTRQKWHCWEDAIEQDESVKNAFLIYWNSKAGTNYSTYEDFKTDHMGYTWYGDGSSEINYFYSVAEQGGHDTIKFSSDGHSNVIELGKEYNSDAEYALGFEEYYEMRMFERTFSDPEFMDWYATNYGLTATKKFTDNYYRILDKSEADLTHLDNLIPSYNSYNIYEHVLDDIGEAFAPISNTYQNFAYQKIQIDALKTNLPMAAALALNTDDVTTADISKVQKEYYKDDLKYWNKLTIEEKTALAKLYKIDPSYAKDLVEHGYHNVTVQRVGYDRADEKCKEMTGSFIDNNDIRNIYRALVGLPTTATTGLGDGLFGSVKGVYNLFCADGIMDEDDYYKLRIAENLKDDTLINTVYNVSSGVGNMIIPLALSAFVPYVGSYAAAVWTGASTAGSERESLRQQGYDDETALKYGICKGLIAACLERVMGGIKGIGSQADEPLAIFSGMLKSNSKTWRFLGNMLSNQIREVGQEITENFAGYVLADGLILNDFPDMDQIAQETWQTAYMTFLSTPFINLMGSGFQKVGRNVPQSVKLNNGLYASYSQAEIEQFVMVNGEFNSEGFYKFLYENNRFGTSTLGSAGGSILNKNTLKLAEVVSGYGGSVTGINPDGSYTIEAKSGEILIASPNEIESGNVANKIKQMNEKYDQAVTYLKGNPDFIKVAEEWLNVKQDGNLEDSDSVRQFARVLSRLDPETREKTVKLVTDSNLEEYYRGARDFRQENGKPYSHLTTYRTHGIGHVLDVLSSTMDAYYTAQATSGGTIDNSYVNTLIVAALVHDTGMYTDLMQDTQSENGRLVFKVAKADTKEDNGDVTRANHSFNSAINTLVLADTISQYFPGVDPVEAALIAFSHSKTNSGIKDLSSPASWSQGIQALQAGIDAHNSIEGNTKILIDGVEGKTILEHFQDLNLITENINYQSGDGQVKIIYYDRKAEVKGKIDVYEFSPELLQRLGNESFLIRVGDANTNNKLLGYNQFGERIVIDPEQIETNEIDLTKIYYKDKDTGELLPIMNYGRDAKPVIAWDKIEEAVPDEIGNSEFRLGDNSTTAGAKYVLGENNQDYYTRIGSDKDGKLYFDEVIVVTDPNLIPYTTISAALERKAEIDSGGKNVMPNRRFVIKVNGNIDANSLAKYELLVKSAPLGTQIVLEIGG